MEKAALLVALLLFEYASTAFSRQGGIRKPSAPFPILVTVNTTRSIASQYLTSWDIQKKESRRLEGEDVNLRIVVYEQEELALLDDMQASGVLSYKEQREHRILQGVSADLNCYRTVDETFASMDALEAQYPDFVTVSSIGESWLKENGQGGHDIRVIVITAPSEIIRKSDMMIVAGHHSRELPPPETIMRWAEHLLENYGKNADITWVLDRTIIHIVPLANPDGREIVQNNLSWRYRKNAHPSGCSRAKNDGVDLNRNYPMWYGDDTGSSSDPCSSEFRGTGPLSEPETSAVFQYANTLFSEDIKRGTVQEAEAKAGEACPDDASGVFIDVHSSGDFVYFPWGHNDIQSPNHHSLLTMGAKLAHAGQYSLWAPDQDGFLYFVSGDATDAAYGVHCVPSFGYELGSSWYAPCAELEGSIVPIMEKSLLYAAKAVSAPYKIPLGPDITNIQVDNTDPRSTAISVQASEEALLVAHAKFSEAKSQEITMVNMWVDVHPDDAANGGITMKGHFDSFEGVADYTLNTAVWQGTHTLYFRATDSEGNQGPVSAVFVEYPTIVWP